VHTCEVYIFQENSVFVVVFRRRGEFLLCCVCDMGGVCVFLIII